MIYTSSQSCLFTELSFEVFLFEPHLVSIIKLLAAAFLLWVKSCLGHFLSRVSTNSFLCQFFSELPLPWPNSSLRAAATMHLATSACNPAWQESQTVSQNSALRAVGTFTCIPAQRENHTISRSLIRAAVTLCLATLSSCMAGESQHHVTRLRKTSHHWAAAQATKSAKTQRFARFLQIVVAMICILFPLPPVSTSQLVMLPV